MSVRTTADEHRDRAREYVAKAADALLEIVYKDCWGSNDYTQQYQQALEESFQKLREVKRLLG